jgi:Tfp pilus assembly protein FimV
MAEQRGVLLGMVRTMVYTTVRVADRTTRAFKLSTQSWRDLVEEARTEYESEKVAARHAQHSTAPHTGGDPSNSAGKTRNGAGEGSDKGAAASAPTKDASAPAKRISRVAPKSPGIGGAPGAKASGPSGAGAVVAESSAPRKRGRPRKTPLDAAPIAPIPVVDAASQDDRVADVSTGETFDGNAE